MYCICEEVSHSTEAIVIDDNNAESCANNKWIVAIKLCMNRLCNNSYKPMIDDTDVCQV